MVNLSAVLAVPPPSPLLIHSLLAGRVGKRNFLVAVQALHSSNQKIDMLSTFSHQSVTQQHTGCCEAN